MNWLGLSPAALAFGFGGAVVGLGLLHLLRVRPRRVKVESLLFARAAAPTPKPVALFGRPARWWAFLLGALILALIVAGAGDPLVVGDGPSRLVLDAGAGDAANTLAAAGVGPRGGRLAVPGSLGARGRDLALATSRPGDPESPLLTTNASNPPVPPIPYVVAIADAVPESVVMIATAESTGADTTAPKVVAAPRDAVVAGPAFLIDAGVDPTERRAVLTTDCPLPLALRDRRGKNLTALAPLPKDAVAWVIDASTGAPLVASWNTPEGARVACVAWLLAPLGHRDVPILVAGALRLLAGAEIPTTAVAGVPFALPALPGATLACVGPDSFTAATADGRRLATFMKPGTYTLEGWFGKRTLTVSAAPSSAPSAPPERLPDPWRLGTALLVVAVAVAGLEAWWHHRGRTP